MRDTLIVINSFIHDMATGVWVAVLFMMYIVSSSAREVMKIPATAGFVSGIMDRLWWAAVASVIVVLVTGIIRALSFKLYGWTGDVAKGRKRLLLMKHVLLGIVFAVGLGLQFVMMSKV